MKVRELINELLDFDPDDQIVVSFGEGEDKEIEKFIDEGIETVRIVVED